MGNSESHHQNHNHNHNRHMHLPNFLHHHKMWSNTVGTGYNVDWESASNGQVPQGAVAGGRDANGETYYVGRARHDTNYLMPGKVQPSHGCIYYPYKGEKKSSTYEVLVNRTGREHLSWVQASNGTVPPNAVLCGHQEHNEQTYIGRHWHEGALVIGKVQPSYHCLYIPFGGREVQYKDYEILISSETVSWNPNTYMGPGYVQPNLSAGPPINPWGGGQPQQQNTYGNASAPINPYGTANIGGNNTYGNQQPNTYGNQQHHHHHQQQPPFNPNFDGNNQQRNW